MFDWLSSLGSVSAYSSRVSAILCLFCGILLFGPDPLISYIGLGPFLTKWRTSIALTFLFSVSVIVIELGRLFLPSLKSWWGVRTVRRHLKYQFKNLSFDEKILLREFLTNDSSTLNPPLGSGVAGSLAAKSIIFRSSQISTYGQGFPYSIQPAALEILRKYPHYLD